MVTIHRGEIPASLRLLAEWWGWSKNRVDRFLNTLEKDGMIKKRTANGTAQTVITVCNYDKYNFIYEKSGQQTGQSWDSNGTVAGQSRDNINKDNKDNNLKNKDKSLYVEFENFISEFNKVKNSKYRANDTVRKQFNARLKEGYTPAQMIEALKNAMNDNYHIGENYRFLTPEFFTRSIKIDKFLNISDNSPKTLQNKKLEFYNELKKQKNGNK